MGKCELTMIFVEKHRGMYNIWGIIEHIKQIEVYNCVGSTVLGSSVGVLLGVSLGVETGWQERILVGLAPLGAPEASLGKSGDVSGRV